MGKMDSCRLIPNGGAYKSNTMKKPIEHLVNSITGVFMIAVTILCFMIPDWIQKNTDVWEHLPGAMAGVVWVSCLYLFQSFARVFLGKTNFSRGEMEEFGINLLKNKLNQTMLNQVKNVTDKSKWYAVQVQQFLNQKFGRND